MKRKESRESVIHEMADLPTGYLPLGTLATDSGGTPLYGYVQRAWERGEFSRSLFRCKGKRFIHENDLSRLTADFTSKSQPEPEFHKGSQRRSPFQVNSASANQLESAIVALCEINNGVTLMLAVLERLTTAVESMATQPQTTHDRLFATAESNGFH